MGTRRVPRGALQKCSHPLCYVGAGGVVGSRGSAKRRMTGSDAFADGMPHVEGVRHRYVDAGGLRVHLAEAGPVDGDPVLMLHGWPQHWYEWRGLVPLLGDSHRLLMPDLRGLGWAEVTEDGYADEHLARDQGD